MKYELTEELREQVKSKHMNAIDCIKFLISNGWKTAEAIEKSSLSNLYTSEHLIKGARLDDDYMHLEVVERENIPVESSVINEDEIYVATSSTVYVNERGIKRRSLETILSNIKTVRKRCRENGVIFSAPTKDEIHKLWFKYVDDYSTYNSLYRRARSFWANAVRNGIMSGASFLELKDNPKGFNELLKKSGTISQVESLVHNTERLLKEDISNYSRVSI